MSVRKIFVLGLPGSGKSSAVRFMLTMAQKRGCLFKMYNDYTILRKWFEAAPDGPEFSRAAHNAFDVHDYAVFDSVLQELERQAKQEKIVANGAMITIEFARNDYLHAFQQFSASFLHNAYFLFIDAENHICKQRTRERSAKSFFPDDHYVSDYIFEAYYKEGRAYNVISQLNELNDRNGDKYAIDIQKMAVVNNVETISIDAFNATLAQLTNLIFEEKNISTALSAGMLTAANEKLPQETTIQDEIINTSITINKEID